MAREFKTALVITGDSKGGVRAVQATESELKKLDRQSKRNTRSASRMSKAYDHVNRNIGTYAASVGIATAGVVALAARQASAANEAYTLANAIGTSTGEVQAFQYAAGQAGIEADKAADIIKDLGDKLGDASLTGGGELADVLDRIGVSSEELQRQKPTEALVTISEAIKDLPQAQQVNVLESIADDGARLLPILRDNGRLLRANMQDAYDFNVAMNEVEVAKMLEANRVVKRLQGQFQGLANEITINAQPAFNELSDTLTDPAVQQGLSDFVSGMSKLVSWSAQFISYAPKIAKGMAIIASGASPFPLAKQIEESQDRVKQLKREIEGLNGAYAATQYGPGAVHSGKPDDARRIRLRLDLAEAEKQLQNLKDQQLEMMTSPPGTGDTGNMPDESLGGINNTGGKYEHLLGEYDKRHEKLVKLREARSKLNKAIEEDPANADGYRRSLAEVNRQIEALGTSSRKSSNQLDNAYQSMSERLSEQIALHGETGQAAKIRYQIEQGKLSALSGQRQQHLIGMAKELDALNEQTQAAKDQKQAIRELFPEFERLQRLKGLEGSISSLPDNMQAYGRRRSNQMLEQAATGGLPQMQGLDPEYNGAFGELNRLQRDKGEYQSAYERRREAFQEYARTHQEDASRAYRALEILEKHHQQRMLQYQQQEQTARRAGYSNLFGELTTLTGQFAGKQSAIYQTMFGASKAFAIADSIVQIQGAIAKAANTPFPANIAAMTAVAAQTAGIVGTIQSTTLSGQAHDGIDSVPNSGTWNLERGERVIDQRTNVDLKQYLSRENKQSQTKSGGEVVFNNTINVKAEPGMSEQDAQRQGRQIGQGVREAMRKTIMDEKRPGGLLSQNG